MNKSNKFSPEVRERAVRMVQEHRSKYKPASGQVAGYRKDGAGWIASSLRFSQ